MDDLSTLISSRLSVSVRIGKVFPAEKREYVSNKARIKRRAGKREKERKAQQRQQQQMGVAD